MKRYARGKAAVASILIGVLLICIFPWEYVAASSEMTEQQAYVNSSVLNVRTGAGTTNPMLKDANGEDVQLTSGAFVTIIGQKTASNGATWYQIRFDYGTQTNLVGYVYGPYLQIFNYEEDPEFLQYLRDQGFPESYLPGLCILHSQFPQWVFEAQQTGLKWSDAVYEESLLGQNLVYYTSPSSWKSTEPGAYIWLNEKDEDGGWVKFDGSKWDPAATKIVQYYMDPRNFLTETGVFQFEVQSYNPKVHTIEGVKDLLSGTFMAGDVPGEYVEIEVTPTAAPTMTPAATGTVAITGTGTPAAANGAATTPTPTIPQTVIIKRPLTYAEVFMEAAELSGVSPYMLAARAIQEMGVNGTSRIISGTVPGYESLYNYFDVGAYTTAEHDLITNGLIYAGKTDAATYRPWNTRRRSIIGGALFLGKQYINRGQDTLYLQKFNVQGKSPYTHQYMTNVQAPSNEAVSAHNAYTNLYQSLVFKIPVYLDMPETKCVRPTGTGNPNAYLKNITVEGYSLTPEFSYDTLEYDLIVPASASTVNVNATAIASKTKVTGTGTISLAYGSNTITITGLAENGNTITYQLQIFRKESKENIETDYLITEHGTIMGIEPDSTLEQVLANVTVTGSSRVYITDASGNEVTEGTVGTGYKLCTDERQLTLMIVGDVNGDGSISAVDLLYVRRYLLEIIQLENEYYEAADVNKDGSVDAIDLLYIKRHLLGLYTITQK